MPKHKIVYLLGAGASIEFLKDPNNTSLSTKDLTEALNDKDRWNNTLGNIKSMAGKNFKDFSLTSDHSFFLLNNFNASFDEVYDTPNRSINVPRNNFESQIAYLDFVASFLSNKKYPKTAQYHPFNHITADRSFYNELQENNEFKMLPIWARETLHGRINEFTFSLKDKEILSNFFNHKLDNYASVNIYSLNYDPLVLESLKSSKFSLGFNAEGRFIEKSYFSSLNTISFLHGHQYFAADTSISLASNSEKALQERVNALWTSNNYVRTQKNISVSFITGINKEKELQADLYNSYFARFCRDIIDADEICCIGYSCGDDHINSILRLGLSLDKRIDIVGNSTITEQSIFDGFLKKATISFLPRNIFLHTEGAKEFFKGTQRGHPIVDQSRINHSE